MAEDLESVVLTLLHQPQAAHQATDQPAKATAAVGGYGSIPLQHSVNTQDQDEEATAEPGQSCELKDTLNMSLCNSPLVHQQHHRASSVESGFESMNSRRSSYENLDLPSELQSQEGELFSYMEKHTSRVEVELRKISLSDQEGQVNENHKGGDGLNSTILSIDGDLEPGSSEDDYVVITMDSLTVSVQEERERYRVTNEILQNLRHEILRLRSHLESECTKLDLLDLLTVNKDNDNTSDDTWILVSGISSKQKRFRSRLDSCIEEVDHQTDNVLRKNNLIVDGVVQNRRYSESPINKLIRSSPIDCVTWLHAMLFLVLLSTLCFMYLWSRSSDEWTVYLRLLRSPLLVILLLYLYGINMKVWAMFKIDYVTILSHPTKAIPTPMYMFKVASFLTVPMTILVIGVIVATPYSTKLPIKIIPVVMWSLLFAFLFNPFDVFLRRVRFNFSLALGRVLLSPFFFVYFSDFFLADQFNSSIPIFLDLEYLICYLTVDPWSGGFNPRACTSSGNGIRPIVSLLPALWRFLQCLRCFYDTYNIKHLVNAGKYFSAFPVVVFATLFAYYVKGHADLEHFTWISICWSIAAFVHGAYTYLWDITGDWGLLSIRCSAFQRKLAYGHKAVYVLAMVLDFILRFFWTLKLTLAVVGEDSGLVFTGLTIAEILRRFTWNFFRIEYAHVLST